MKCPYCKKENPEDARFCINCSKPLKKVEQSATKKFCPKGHEYDFTVYAECPYCPKQDYSSSFQQMKSESVGEETELNFDGNENETVDIKNRMNNLDETIIELSDKDNTKKYTPILGKKIVGWLITYTWDARGEDYKLYEGANIIGRNNEEAHVNLFDQKVTHKHCTILYRPLEKKFKIYDEKSLNCTFVNGESIDTVELKDGDKIKIGETEFIFKSVQYS